jgi:hypothetical protein
MPVIDRQSSLEDSIEQRIEALRALLGLVQLVPESWTVGSSSDKREKNPAEGLPSVTCTDYKEMITAWRKAMRWRSEMEDALSIMLAIALSTSQVGDQLFLMLIAEAGAGKTRFCDAMLVSRYCYALEHLTGFHSGWKDESGEDYSLLSRINHKTLITPEGDVVMSGPNFQEIMSQQRRIFDGTSGASYKNRKEDLRYTGLRTPWIIAGTPALMATDQSRLGDRFLRVILESPAKGEQEDIMRRVGYTALRSVLQESDGDASSCVEGDLCLAYQLTGGYVDYLRTNAQEILASIVVDEERVVSKCMELAAFTANLRARPEPDQRKDVPACKEMPTRLTHQLVRLAVCIAGVIGHHEIDTEVMRRVRKVAMDTARGQTMALVALLYSSSEGLGTNQLVSLTGKPGDKLTAVLRFMRDIDLVEYYEPTAVHGVKQRPRWRLTKEMRRSYGLVVENWNT